jgi:hypothetical protein
MVVHMGGGMGGGAAPASVGGAAMPGRVAPPLPVEPPPEPVEPPLPEQEPISVGLQVKPAPQSASLLQGSCHLNAQTLVMVVVHSGGWGGEASQGTLAGQATAVPPEQAIVFCS